MTKQTLITILLLLTVVNGWAQKIWTNPSYRNEPQGFQYDVKEVEFRNDETVLHITVRNHPNAKFSFGSCTVLKTEDGRSYPIISAKKHAMARQTLRSTPIYLFPNPARQTWRSTSSHYLKI